MLYSYIRDKFHVCLLLNPRVDENFVKIFLLRIRFYATLSKLATYLFQDLEERISHTTDPVSLKKGRKRETLENSWM